MRIVVHHVTRYTYATEAAYSIQALRMTPADFAAQRTVRWEITSEPRSAMSAATDEYGNRIHLMTIDQPHKTIEIRVSGVVDVIDQQGLVTGLVDSTPTRLFLRRTPLTEATGGIEAMAAAVAGAGRIDALHTLMNGIRDAVDYRPGVTNAATTAAEALTHGYGVCQDHAHIFIAAARAAGIPARYVTGYLLLENQEAAEAHHAWAEAWVDGLGWLGFDVANRICPTDRYVRMAVGLDAWSAMPIRGSRRGGAAEKLEVEVRVTSEDGVIGMTQEMSPSGMSQSMNGLSQSAQGQSAQGQSPQGKSQQ